jgi:hypothetical protein
LEGVYKEGIRGKILMKTERTTLMMAYGRFRRTVLICSIDIINFAERYIVNNRVLSV